MPQPPEHTSLSLIHRLLDHDRESWQLLFRVYGPLIRAWLRQNHINPRDIEDLSQDILAVVVQKLPEFEHAGRVGSFRNWLRNITVLRSLEYFRNGRLRVEPVGGSTFLQLIHELEDPNSGLTKNWNRLHDDHILAQLLASLDGEFLPQTVQAFRWMTFEKRSVESIPGELGMTVVAVYGARARVLRRLREEAAKLL